MTGFGSSGNVCFGSGGGFTPPAGALTIVPTAPLVLAGVGSNAQVALTWQHPTSSGQAPVLSYNVYQGTTPGGETLLANTSSLTYTSTGLTDGTAYYFKVTAINSFGEGPASNEVAVIPPASGYVPDPFATGSDPPQPFTGSFWDTAIPANVPAWWSGGVMVAGNSPTLVSNFVAIYTSQYGSPYIDPHCTHYIMNTTGADPGVLRTWTFNPGKEWDSAPQGTYSVLCPSPSAAVPTGFLIGAPIDREVAFWDYGNALTMQFWATTFAGGSSLVPILPPSSNTGQLIPSGGSDFYCGFGPDTFSSLSSSTTACGAPYIAGPITYADFLAGAIKHPLMMAVGNPTSIPVNPAYTSDGVSYKAILNGGIPEGTWFMMPSSVSMPNFAAGGTTAPNVALCEMIFTCFQDYGAIVIDSTAGGGITMLIESAYPWEYSPDVPNPWCYDWTESPYGHIFGSNMPWSSLVAIEPGCFPLPNVSDGNASTDAVLVAAQAVGKFTTATTSVTLSGTTSTNDLLVVSGTVDSGTLGNVISGAGGTWVKVYENPMPSSGQPLAFCWVGYGCASGHTTISTTLQGNGDMIITRWSGFGASNPVIASTITPNGTGTTKSFATGTIATTGAGQLCIGMLHSPLGGLYVQFSYVEGSENAYRASGNTNYAGTNWSNSQYNRHILGSNTWMLTSQCCNVPSSTGNISANIVVNGAVQIGQAGMVILAPS